MIETTNNIIFYAGYFCIIGAFLALGLAGFWTFFEKIMQSKRFFSFIFNNRLEKRLKEISEKDFYKWHKELEERWKAAEKC